MSAFLAVLILGIVEGITEYLPISSTGHLILAEKFLKTPELSPEFLKSFYVIIQLGAIFSVVVYFWKDLTPFLKDKEEFKERMSLWSKIIVGVIPSAILGVLFDDKIEEIMDGTTVIAIALIFYGIILIFIEDKLKIKAKVKSLKEISYKLAIYIGLFQCLALIPGTSRSGATIIGALLLGVSRAAGAEFSFFLAIPTMAGATLLKLVKNGFGFTNMEWILLAEGLIVSFIVAYIVTKWFMGYIRTRTFKVFGYYRVIVGILVLLLM